MEKPVDPQELLSVFDDCGDAFQSLHQAVDTLKHGMDCELSISNVSDENNVSLQDRIGEFMSNDQQFWKDILTMQSEVKPFSLIPFSLIHAAKIALIVACQ